MLDGQFVRFKALVKKLLPDCVVDQCRKRFGRDELRKYAFSYAETTEIEEDIRNKYRYDGELATIFSANKGNLVHKWNHYIPLYDRYFAPFRGQAVKMLEIGVSQGGSLQMWRTYFGEDAIIFGIDIDPECARYNGLAGQVRIGSQTDESFLESVIREMGGVDIVLDDGSHRMNDIPVTLNHLFPCMSYGGVYLIEDLHTAYWRNFGGGYGARGNFFRFIMTLVDDMHRWYHKKGMVQPAISENCSGIHVHDSIVVLEKNKVHQPAHSRIV